MLSTNVRSNVWRLSDSVERLSGSNQCLLQWAHERKWEVGPVNPPVFFIRSFCQAWELLHVLEIKIFEEVIDLTDLTCYQIISFLSLWRLTWNRQPLENSNEKVTSQVKQMDTWGSFSLEIEHESNFQFEFCLRDLARFALKNCNLHFWFSDFCRLATPATLAEKLFGHRIAAFCRSLLQRWALMANSTFKWRHQPKLATAFLSGIWKFVGWSVILWFQVLRDWEKLQSETCQIMWSGVVQISILDGSNNAAILSDFFLPVIGGIAEGLAEQSHWDSSLDVLSLMSSVDVEEGCCKMSSYGGSVVCEIEKCTESECQSHPLNQIIHSRLQALLALLWSKFSWNQPVLNLKKNWNAMTWFHAISWRCLVAALFVFLTQIAALFFCQLNVYHLGAALMGTDRAERWLTAWQLLQLAERSQAESTGNPGTQNEDVYSDFWNYC